PAPAHSGASARTLGAHTLGGPPIGSGSSIRNDEDHAKRESAARRSGPDGRRGLWRRHRYAPGSRGPFEGPVRTHPCLDGSSQAGRVRGGPGHGPGSAGGPKAEGRTGGPAGGPAGFGGGKTGSAGAPSA